MSVLQVKWVSVSLPVVQPPRLLVLGLHRLHVRWRRLGRWLRKQPLPMVSEPGERMLARV
ncbi:MAG: hypothetical protein QM783_20550 [Phycisphaerales bacterium]